MAGRALTIDIRTDDRQTIAALNRVKKSLGNVDQQAQRTRSSGLGLGSALGGLAIGAGLSHAIGEFEEAEKTARQTTAAIESTGNAAGVSAEEQDKLAGSLSKLAAVDDELIGHNLNVLRTFTDIKNVGADKVFDNAALAALNLSAAMEGDLQGATIMVGKALNDPIKGISAMSRAGIQFTSDQKAMIRSLVESGDKLGAQKIILKELEVQFGGQAAAAATDSAKMKLAFDNAAEAAGKTLAPALGSVASGAEKASNLFAALPSSVTSTVLVMGAAALAVSKVKDKLQEAGGVQEGFGKKLAAFSTATAVLSLTAYGKELANFSVDANQALGETEEGLVELAAVINDLDQNEFVNMGRQNIDSLYAMRDAVKAAGGEYPALNDAIKQLEGEQVRSKKRTDEYAGAHVDSAEATDKSAESTERLRKAQQDLAEQTDELREAVLGSFGAATNYAQAVDATVQKTNELILANALHKEGSQEQKDAVYSLRDAVEAQIESKVASARADAEAKGGALDAASAYAVQQREVRELSKVLGPAGFQSILDEILVREAKLAATVVSPNIDVSNAIAALRALGFTIDEIQAKLRAALPGSYDASGRPIPTGGGALPVLPGAGPVANQRSGDSGNRLPGRGGNLRAGNAAPIIQVETMNLGGPYGVAQIEAVLNQHERGVAQRVTVGAP